MGAKWRSCGVGAACTEHVNSSRKSREQTVIFFNDVTSFPSNYTAKREKMQFL